jgi:hypothetical protein
MKDEGTTERGEVGRVTIKAVSPTMPALVFKHN